MYITQIVWILNDLKILLVGVKQDGLVHISELANRFVSDPAEVVKLHQHVKVKVLEVDIPRKRIAFSMKKVE